MINTASDIFFPCAYYSLFSFKESLGSPFRLHRHVSHTLPSRLSPPFNMRLFNLTLALFAASANTAPLHRLTIRTLVNSPEIREAIDEGGIDVTCTCTISCGLGCDDVILCL